MTRHAHASGVRIGFADAPAHVREWVARTMGAEVASVVDCAGGMSPGPAARIRSVSGRAGFVKACGAELNPMTPQLLRAERQLLADVPVHPNLPRLLDSYDDGDWVVLLLEDLPGELPKVPWSTEDLRRASAVLAELRPVLDRVAAEWVPLAHDAAPIFTDGWRLLADRLDQVDPWWAKHHDELASHAVRAATLLEGDALLHWDVRADNLIFGEQRDVLIDWGQARRGAPWLDHAILAMDCALSGADTSALQFFRADPASSDRDPGDLVSLMAAAAMTFAARSTEAAPPGLPTMPELRARWADNLRHELDHIL